MGEIIPWLILIVVGMAALVGFSFVAIQGTVQIALRARRQHKRKDLYVPVAARVRRVIYHDGCATLHVAYKYEERIVTTRFLVEDRVAALAEHSKRISLMIDPDHPEDVVVAPAFEEHAAEARKPILYGAKSYPDFALHAFGIVAFGGFLGVAGVLIGSIDDEQPNLGITLAVVLVSMALIYFVLLIHGRFAFNEQMRDRERRKDRKQPRRSTKPTAAIAGIDGPVEPQENAPRGE